jgi:large subunit ribosomal protein L5
MIMISIEKITINIGTGQAGEKLEKAKKLVEKMTQQKAVENVTQKRIPQWGVRKGLAIGVKTTMRGKKAADFLNKCLDAVDRKIKPTSFDKFGNFSFGIKEYIDVPGFKYDPEIGMYGFDVCVTMRKWGYRVSERKVKTSKYPKRHIIKAAETMEYMKKNFNIEVSE